MTLWYLQGKKDELQRSKSSNSIPRVNIGYTTEPSHFTGFLSKQAQLNAYQQMHHVTITIKSLHSFVDVTT